MMVFWQKGYEGASIFDLMAATGLKKSSIYKAFNSKEDLFWKANELYKTDHLGFIEEALKLSKPRDIAMAMLVGEADMHTDPVHPPGCFETNGALACSDETQELQRALVESRFNFQRRLAKAFRLTSENGPMLPNATPEEAASFVFTLIQGMAVQAKAGLSRAELHKFVELAMLGWPSGEARPNRSSRQLGDPSRENLVPIGDSNS
ncbi:TetR/AcrR family transcriptional regulator [Rhizobium leguminosarum]|uniref:TetR/AcrR family transcriptional regulator n=2 Tax=Rhizobium TaxID=379 RepID=UPI0024783DE5|nr:TetR/AcrR family transcriptional regulator [Rhizobium leguminosarum]